MFVSNLPPMLFMKDMSEVSTVLAAHLAEVFEDRGWAGGSYCEARTHEISVYMPLEPSNLGPDLVGASEVHTGAMCTAIAHLHIVPPRHMLLAQPGAALTGTHQLGLVEGHEIAAIDHHCLSIWPSGSVEIDTQRDVVMAGPLSSRYESPIQFRWCSHTLNVVLFCLFVPQSLFCICTRV